MAKIRPVESTDFPRLADIYKESYNSLNIGEEWTHETALKLLHYHFKAQPDLFFVAQEADSVVGGITADLKPWWDGNHLVEGELFVSPTHQGKGIGKQLIKKLFEKAQEKYNAISWDTFTHIVYEHPLSWYKKLGFEEIKQSTRISGDLKKVLNKLSV